jgi:hypothetical protein
LAAALDPLIASLRGWTPLHVAVHEPRVDWAVVTAPPADAFFEQDAERAMQRLFNRLFARRTRLDVLEALGGASDTADVREPAGIIAHVSRCGSTLATQMLGRLRSAVVLSEAQPFDALFRRRNDPAFDDARLVRMLRGLVRAFGDDRDRRVIVKLHAWHVLQLDLVRRAFPSVPLVVMMREPRAVLRSQDERIGAELVPNAVPPPLLRFEPANDVAAPDFGARVIAAFYGAALRQAGDPSTIVVDHAELPGAVVERIAPFFGMPPSADERSAMHAIAALDTKRSVEGTGVRRPPAYAKADDGVPEAIDAQARRWLDEPYAALQALASRSFGASR